MYLIEKERKNRVLPLKSLRQEVTNITSLLLHWWNLVLWPHQNTKASRNVCGPTAVNQKKAYTRKGGAWIFEQLNISAIELDLVGQFLTELPWIWALAIIGTQEWPIHGMKDLNWITYLMILQKKKKLPPCVVYFSLIFSTHFYLTFIFKISPNSIGQKYIEHFHKLNWHFSIFMLVDLHLVTRMTASSFTVFSPLFVLASSSPTSSGHFTSDLNLALLFWCSLTVRVPKRLILTQHFLSQTFLEWSYPRVIRTTTWMQLGAHTCISRHYL